MKTFVFLLLIAILLVPYPANAIEPGTRPKIVVTIAPLTALVQGVTKDTADVTVMVPPGSDPHTYEPKPSQLKELSGADVYVMLGSGMDFERAWMDRLRALNRKMYVCDSGENVPLIDMTEPGHAEPGHHHGNKDPHIWLSLPNAMAMVKNIAKGLSAANPDNSDFYAVNAKEYIVELTNLDAEMRVKLAAAKGGSFIVFHPAWGYFARDYGLKEIPVEAAGKDPTAKELAGIMKKAKELGARTVFVSPQFSRKSAEVIAKEIGASVVAVDPLAADYENNLRRAADEFSKGVK